MENLFNMLLPMGFYFLGAVLAVVLVWTNKQYIVPFLKQKLGNEKYAELVTNIKDLMAACDDKFGKGQGLDKKAWVINQLKELNIDFNEEYVSNLIDGFTKQLTADGIINIGK